MSCYDGHTCSVTKNLLNNYYQLAIVVHEQLGLEAQMNMRMCLKVKTKAQIVEYKCTGEAIQSCLIPYKISKKSKKSPYNPKLNAPLKLIMFVYTKVK